MGAIPYTVGLLPDLSAPDDAISFTHSPLEIFLRTFGSESLGNQVQVIAHIHEVVQVSIE